MDELANLSSNFQILQTLKAAPLQIFSREDLLIKTNCGEENFDRAIDSHIKRLRKKEDAAHIKTVYGGGYFYDPHPYNYQLISYGQNYSLWEVINPKLIHKSGLYMRIGSFELDTGCNRLFFGNRFCQLPPKELRILKFFFISKTKERVYSHEELERHLGLYGDLTAEKKLAHVLKHVREKFRVLAGPKTQKIIKNVYSIGWQFDPDIALLFSPAAVDGNGFRSRNPGSSFCLVANECGKKTSVPECHHRKDSRRRQTIKFENSKA